MLGVLSFQMITLGPEAGRPVAAVFGNNGKVLVAALSSARGDVLKFWNTSSGVVISESQITHARTLAMSEDFSHLFTGHASQVSCYRILKLGDDRIDLDHTGNINTGSVDVC